MQLNTQASFEVIHGALCLLMTKIGAKLGTNFSLKENDGPVNAKYFPGRGADVILEGKVCGSIGVLHPEVLKNFELKNPVSCLELDFSVIWDYFSTH